MIYKPREHYQHLIYKPHVKTNIDQSKIRFNLYKSKSMNQLVSQAIKNLKSQRANESILRMFYYWCISTPKYNYILVLDHKMEGRGSVAVLEKEEAGQWLWFGEGGGHHLQRRAAALSAARLGTIQSYSHLISLLWFVNQEKL